MHVLQSEIPDRIYPVYVVNHRDFVRTYVETLSNDPLQTVSHYCNFVELPISPRYRRYVIVRPHRSFLQHVTVDVDYVLFALHPQDKVHPASLIPAKMNTPCKRHRRKETERFSRKEAFDPF